MYQYYKIIKGMTMEGKFNLRLQLVEYARQFGKKAAMRSFKLNKATVNKWVERYNEEGLQGLLDRSRAPKKQWKKCDRAFEAKVIRLRRKTKNKYGALKLKERFNLERSPTCINRIIQERPKLRRKRKTKHEKRNELRAVKKLMKTLGLIQVDVKELMDISNYYVQQWVNPKLPKYEITARDVKSGATWVCLADTKESVNTAAFISMLIQHLKEQGFDLDAITIQTDNGTEFHNKPGQELSLFDKVLDHFQVKQDRIPPAAPTFNSDVETFHRLVEDEFYSIERFRDVEDMERQLYTHMIDFNYLRKNSYKENKAPIEFLREDWPDINENLFNFPVVRIDKYRYFYYDLFPERQKKQVIEYDPAEYFLFHGIDPNDLPGGYHVSSFHRLLHKSLKFLARANDTLVLCSILKSLPQPELLTPSKEWSCRIHYRKPGWGTASYPGLGLILTA